MRTPVAAALASATGMSERGAVLEEEELDREEHRRNRGCRTSPPCPAAAPAARSVLRSSAVVSRS